MLIKVTKKEVEIYKKQTIKGKRFLKKCAKDNENSKIYKKNSNNKLEPIFRKDILKATEANNVICFRKKEEIKS